MSEQARETWQELEPIVDRRRGYVLIDESGDELELIEQADGKWTLRINGSLGVWMTPALMAEGLHLMLSLDPRNA